MTWPSVRFGDILERNLRPYTLAADEDANLVGMRLYGGGPFHRELKPAQQIAKKSHFVIKSGDVIYNKLFAWKGTFGIVPPHLDGMFVSDKFPTYKLDRSRVEERYLQWWFRNPALWDQAKARSTGSAALSKLTLNPPKFLELTIPLPELHDQRRVVARLDAIDSRVSTAGTLHVTQKRELALLRAQVLRFLPAGGERTLGEWVDFQTGYAFKSEWFAESGVRLARNANVGHGILDWSDTVRIASERVAEFERFALSEGDILVSLDRPLISTGVKVARVRQEDLPCLLLQRVARAQFDSEVLDPRYLFLWLQSPRFTEAIDPGRSNGVPHISHKDIMAIPFALPSLAEQAMIVRKVDATLQRISAASALSDDMGDELGALTTAAVREAFV